MAEQLITGPDTFPKEQITIEAAAARTQGTVVRIDSSAEGLLDVALADDTNVYKVGVVATEAATGDKYLLTTKGETTMTVPSGNFTAGNGVHILDGAVADSTATAEKPNGLSANNDFGVVMVGGTGVTEVTVYLYGDAITAQT